MHFSLRIAQASLATHKLRAALAMLGVFLGALALTGVQHMSLAMVRKAEAEVEKLGPNLFMARAGQLRFRRAGVGIGADPHTFTRLDAEALAAGMPAVLAAAPFTSRTMPVRKGDSTVMCQLVGTIPAYQQVRSFRPELGRFFTEQESAEAAKVCVLGRSIAERLFRRPEAAPGQEVYMYRAALRVVGVMEVKGADIAGTDQDEQVFVPLATAMRRLGNQDWISGTYLQLAPGADPQGPGPRPWPFSGPAHIAPGARTTSLCSTPRTHQAPNQPCTGGLLGLISSTVSFAVGAWASSPSMVLLVREPPEIGVRGPWAPAARHHAPVRVRGLPALGRGGLAGVGASLVLVSAVYVVGGFPPGVHPLVITGALAGSATLACRSALYPAGSVPVDILTCCGPE
jgi:putative ABC transport system permease protein